MDVMIFYPGQYVTYQPSVSADLGGVNYGNGSSFSYNVPNVEDVLEYKRQVVNKITKLTFHQWYSGGGRANMTLPEEGELVIHEGEWGFWEKSHTSTGETKITKNSYVAGEFNLINKWVPLAGGGDDFSLAGMYLHFQVGGGEPMTINSSSIDFSGTSQRELGLTGMTKGEVRPVNLFDAVNLNQAALAFGRVNMMYHGNNQFSIVTDESSRFDFYPLYDSGASWGRNAENILGAAINYNLWLSPAAALVPLICGGPYPVYFYGTTTIPR